MTELPPYYDITILLGQLRRHLKHCFDSTGRLRDSAQSLAMACMKANYQLCLEHHQDNSLHIHNDGVQDDNGWRCIIPVDQNFRIISCIRGNLIRLDIASLSSWDRMWLAHMFPYRLHEGDYDSAFEIFVIYFIRDFLLDLASPLRPVADCLLSAGLLVGLQIARDSLLRHDKR